jgi:hypothetical protein
MIFCARATHGRGMPSLGLMARPGVPMGGRVRRLRAVEDQSAPIPKRERASLEGANGSSGVAERKPSGIPSITVVPTVILRSVPAFLLRTPGGGPATTANVAERTRSPEWGKGSQPGQILRSSGHVREAQRYPCRKAGCFPMDKGVFFYGNVEWKPSLSGVASDGTNRKVCGLWMGSLSRPRTS